MSETLCQTVRIYNLVVSLILQWKYSIYILQIATLLCHSSLINGHSNYYIVGERLVSTFL